MLRLQWKGERSSLLSSGKSGKTNCRSTQKGDHNAHPLYQARCGYESSDYCHSCQQCCGNRGEYGECKVGDQMCLWCKVLYRESVCLALAFQSRPSDHFDRWPFDTRRFFLSTASAKCITSPRNAISIIIVHVRATTVARLSLSL